MIDRILRYGFAAFLVLLPIQTVWLWHESFIGGVKWQYGTIGLYGTDILLLAIILLLVMSRLRRKSFIESVTPAWFHDPVNSMLSFLIMWSGLSLLWSDEKLLAGYFFLNLILAFSIFHLARTIRFSQESVILTFVLVSAVAFLESVLGIWQFFSQSSFASTLLGMSGYESWQAGVSVLKNESGRWLRAYGTFPHPNMFGAYLGAILAGVVGYAVFSAKKLIVPVSIILVLLLGLIVSFSRSAWIGIVLSFVLLAVSVVVYGDREQKYRLAKILGIIGVATGIFISVLHETVFPRFDGSVIQKEASIIDRTMLARQAMEIIKEHLVFGVGAGNYTLAVMRKHPEISVWDVQPVHDVFLLVFAELGVIGALLFIGFLVSVFVRGFKNLFSEDKKENAIFIIVLLSLLPSLFLDHFLWDSHFGLLFFFLLAGFSLRKFNT